MTPLFDGFLRAGDVVFSRGQSLLARLIRWGQKSRGEEPSLTNHAILVVGSGWTKYAEIVEADVTVRSGSLGQYHRDDYCYVFRPLNVSAEDLQKMAAWAQHQVGRRYGFLQLAFQLIDFKLFGGRVVARQAARLDPRPICSRLVATAYSRLNLSFGMPSFAADPDEMMDFCVSNPDKYLKVWEGYPR